MFEIELLLWAKKRIIMNSFLNIGDPGSITGITLHNEMIPH